MEIKVNVSSDKKDLVKAGNTTTMFKDVVGTKLTITGIIIYSKEEVDSKTGEIQEKEVCAIKKKDGEFISSISPTVANSLQLIVGAYEPEEIKAGIDVEIKSKKSHSGRDFLYIDLV